MYGPRIITRSISARRAPDKYGNSWQYNPRSDHHSKVACWAILFDLLLCCEALRRHAEAAAVGFGINHEMRDFRTNRKKNLDLVICSPGAGAVESPATFAELAEKYGIQLSGEEARLLEHMPLLREAPVGGVMMALEAKAAMTEHSKARPRLHDELDSSHATVHGAVENAIAVGLVMVNAGGTFVSPERNKFGLRTRRPVVTNHTQPKAAQGILQKVLEIRRRERIQDVGFDALGAIIVNCPNDGSAVEIVDGQYPEVAAGQLLNYEGMIHRIGQLYASRFATG